MLIGELARRAGVTPQTIRYYETLGVLPRPHRSEGGYRQYSQRALDDLGFIRNAQRLGFSLADVGQILTLARAGKAPCTSVLSLAEAHLSALDQRIAELQYLRGQLSDAVKSWKDGGAPEHCAATLCGLITAATTHSAKGARRASLRRSGAPGRAAAET